MTNAKWDTDSIQDQKGRVIIVTGSTSGIGKEAALDNREVLPEFKCLKYP